MRSIATLVAITALAGALVVPAPATAVESPLPQLTQGICQAKDADLPQTASAPVAPVEPQAPAVPETAQAPESPQLCATG